MQNWRKVHTVSEQLIESFGVFFLQFLLSPTKFVAHCWCHKCFLTTTVINFQWHILFTLCTFVNDPCCAIPSGFQCVTTTEKFVHFFFRFAGHLNVDCRLTSFQSLHLIFFTVSPCRQWTPLNGVVLVIIITFLLIFCGCLLFYVHSLQSLTDYIAPVMTAFNLTQATNGCHNLFQKYKRMWIIYI